MLIETIARDKKDLILKQQKHSLMITKILPHHALVEHRCRTTEPAEYISYRCRS
jgi:hypothetical protein